MKVSRLRRWLPPLAIAVLVFAFFTPFLFQGKYFLAADTLFQFFPWRSYVPQGYAAKNSLITDPVNMNYSFSEFYNTQLKQGKLVNWSPNIIGGIPFSGGRSYPLNLLFHGLFATHIALTLALITHLLLMGWFMYLFLREIGAGDRGAVFGATAYMFNGCAMVWLSFETVIPHAAYVPLLLLLMERYQGRRRYFSALLGALVLGLVFLIGHIQYLLYVGMIMLFYGAFVLARAAWRKAPAAELLAIAACGAITAVGGVLVGALETWPTYEVINYSSRVSRTFEFSELFSILGSVPYRWLVTLIFPDYFGSPVLHFGLFPSPPKEYLNYNELCLYMGVPTLFAFAALAARPRTAHARFFLGLTVLVTAMLAGSVLFYPFYRWYPGMDKLNPMRMIFIFAFAAAAAAGLGIRTIEEATGKWRGMLIGVILALTGVAVFLALASSSPRLISFFNADSAHFGNGGLPPGFIADLAFRRALSTPQILKPLVLTLLAGSLFALWVWFGKKRWALVFPVLVTALLGYDLISFGWNYNTLVERRHIYPVTPSIAFLQQQPGPFRVVQDARRGFFVNDLQPFGIQEIGGYSNVYPERVNKLMSFIEFGPAALEGRLFDRWVMFSKITNPLLDVLNVKYVLTAPGIRLPENGRYKLVFDQEITIYENLRALPRAFAVHRPVLLRDAGAIISYMGSGTFDPRSEVILEEAPPAGFAAAARANAAPSAVIIDRYAFDEVALTAEMAADGWVVLADTYYPGWEAEVDGKAATILRADCALRAVPVPAGKHRVTFRYRPAAIGRGRLVSLLGLLLVIGGLVITRRSGARAGGESEPA